MNSQKIKNKIYTITKKLVETLQKKSKENKEKSLEKKSIFKLDYEKMQLKKVDTSIQNRMKEYH
jgi:hypothetical protein